MVESRWKRAFEISIRMIGFWRFLPDIFNLCQVDNREEYSTIKLEEKFYRRIIGCGRISSNTFNLGMLHDLDGKGWWNLRSGWLVGEMPWWNTLSDIFKLTSPIPLIWSLLPNFLEIFGKEFGLSLIKPWMLLWHDWLKCKDVVDTSDSSVVSWMGLENPIE